MAEPIVRISSVSKIFDTEDGPKAALKDIDLSIDEGSIYGLIGLSGAGKSTLVRLINGIESPTSGDVVVLGRKVNGLSQKELRGLRGQIGMIFQQFNLMPSRTVFDNVLFPLRGEKLGKQEKTEKVEKLLRLVGLEEKRAAYPSELSGGQQQRVAIARALARDPKILLCDEATSALDPTTTRSILQLIREVNRTLGVTVVIVTHQMSVVKEVCDEVAVLDKGVIVEKGSVFSVFANPQAELTKAFIDTTSNLGQLAGLTSGDDPVVKLKPGQRFIRMRYVSRDVSEPLVSEITKRFDVELNIFLSDVEIVAGAPIGGIVGVLDGTAEHIGQAIEFLRGKNIQVEVLNHD